MNRSEELEAMLAHCPRSLGDRGARLRHRLRGRLQRPGRSGDARPIARPTLSSARGSPRCSARCPVVAEESDESEFAGWVGAPRVFFVDPLDGTLRVRREERRFRGDDRSRRRRPRGGGRGDGTCARHGVDRRGGVGAFEIAPAGARTPIRVSETNDLGEREHGDFAIAPIGRDASASSIRWGSRRLRRWGARGSRRRTSPTARADVYLQPGRAGSGGTACARRRSWWRRAACSLTRMGEPMGTGGPSSTNNRGFSATNGKLHERVLEQLTEARG